MIGILIEIASRLIKSRMKKTMFEKYGNSTDQKHSEYYLAYYQRIQVIDVIRAVSIVAILFVILTFKSGNNFGFLAVGLGALIITFKDFILSIIAFFFVTPQYPIGLTVKVGGVQGQIIFIRAFHVGLLGKDGNGENTGELFTIPNHKFITEIVEKEDLRSGSIVRDEIKIPFSKKDFTLPFEEFMKNLRVFLDETFPMKNTKNVGNYQSYIGHKYKIDFSYLDDKCVTIEIRFVGKPEHNIKNKEKIIGFVDTQIEHSESGEKK